MCGSCAEIRIATAVLLQQKKRQPDNLFFWVYFYRKVFLFISDSEDSFRMRSSSICLDLRLDMPIIFYSLYLDDFIVFGILKCIF